MAPRAGRPWSRLFIALAILLIVAAIAGWLQRRTIARDFIDRELARRGVPARYEITQLSPWKQRLSNVVVGDPRRPDLTADWLEVRTALAPWRAEVLEVRAGKLRLRGRIVDGQLSLGTLDRLMPAPSGKPFALPRLIVDVADAQIALDSPAGAVQLALTGKGMLTDGFAGTLSAATPRLAASGCTLDRVRARVAVKISGNRPKIDGPVEMAEAACGDARLRAGRVTVQAQLGAAFDRWRGNAQLQVDSVEQPGVRLTALGGDASFDGDVRATRGRIAMRVGGFDLSGSRGRAAGLNGDYAVEGSRIGFDGHVQLGSATLSPVLRSNLRQATGGVSAGPLQPIVTALARATDNAAAAFGLSSDLSLNYAGDTGALTLARTALRANSGARIDFDGTARLGFGARATPAQASGTLATSGGGMPDTRLRFTRGPDGIRGTGTIQPYAAGGTRLAVTGLDFRISGANGQATALADFSGTLAQGRIDRLRLPLDASWSSGSVRFNARCVDVPFGSAAVGGLTLGAHRLSLCPLDGAMVRIDGGRLGGGLDWRRPRLDGTLGGSPLRFAADQLRFELGPQRFGLTSGAVRLGAAGETKVEVATLSGALSGRPGGVFSGLAGQIGSVPLLVSAGTGDWALVDGSLSLTGGLEVRDSAASARFLPLATRNANVRVDGSDVLATATLNTLAGDTKVADVRIGHHLGSGAGSADIDVDALRFVSGGFQPNDITPLTFGVIADVQGTVSGKGRIAWNRDGVTSSGTFGTQGVDLAAAFGQVRGLATTLHFTDLLGMRTAPGETAKVVEVNPGVPVNDGVIRYQILGSQRVQVEGGRWPFAGGELALEPTLLDFSEQRERRLTFQVKGADAALFLKQMDFDNISATGTFDGTLPMIFDESGGRIEGGTLQARGGGSIAYVGEVSRHDLGFWGNTAFDALRALNYRSLSLGMNGPLAGDMVTQIRFAGVSQGEGTKSNFLIRRLAKLPMIFNIQITAPFQQLLSSVQSWYDPSRLIERNLPALLEAQGTSVQQPESPAVRQKEPK